jgi:hypothetical protein
MAQASFLEKVGRSNMPERGLVVFGGIGVAAVKSDICGLPECNKFGPAFTIGGLYKLSPYLGVGVNASQLRFGATEKDPTRPLDVTFQTEVTELVASITINLLDSYAGSGNYRSLRKRFVVPYVRGGGGMIYYTATSYPGKGDLEDTQMRHDPVRDYPAISAVIPMAGGIRFRFSDEFSIVPELVYNITLTDHLDNIGEKESKNTGTDHYMNAYIKVMYTPVLKNKILTRKY